MSRPIQPQEVKILPRPAGTFPKQDTPPRKRTRVSRGKVSTGCITCKIRRVKCDEGKPTCERCKKAFFICDGYGDGRPDKHNMGITTFQVNPQGRALVPRGIPSARKLDENDALYFELFQSKLIYDLSGHLFFDFWSRVVLCEAVRDDCATEAVLAIGALCRAITVCTTSHSPSTLDPWSYPNIVNKDYEAAIRHYIKALSLFRTRLSKGLSMISSRSVCITSILFTTYELLQGNSEAADTLMTHSIHILGSKLKRQCQSQDGQMLLLQGQVIQGQTQEEREMEDVDQVLPYISIMSGYTPFLRSQSDNIAMWDISRGLQLPDLHRSSINKLQTQWVRFYTTVNAFVGRAHIPQFQGGSSSNNNAVLTFAPPHSSSLHQETLSHQALLISHLQTWMAEISNRLTQQQREVQKKQPPNPVNNNDDNNNKNNPALPALQTMQIQALTLQIVLNSLRDPTELIFDSHLPSFLHLLRLCLSFLRENCPGPTCSNPLSPHSPTTTITTTATGNNPTPVYLSSSKIPKFGGPDFTLNTSILAALAVVVVKCRDHDVRMMAVAIMMGLRARREGAWEAVVMLYWKLGLLWLEERGRVRVGSAAAGDNGEGEEGEEKMVMGCEGVRVEDRWGWRDARWEEEEVDQGGKGGKVLIARYVRIVSLNGGGGGGDDGVKTLRIRVGEFLDVCGEVGCRVDHRAAARALV